MLRLLVTLVSAAAAAALAGSAVAAPGGAGLASATGRTIGGTSARFSLVITARLSGISVRTSERGAVSFARRQAHVYKIVPGGGIPEEIILIGPWEYTNANVLAALNDPGVRPWTKLDTRRLPTRLRAARIDDRAHVEALVYLSEGVASPARVARVSSDGTAVHFRGVVEPARMLARVPSAERRAVRAALAADYSVKPFRADFWLDRHGRLVRVQVSYRTARGGRIAVRGDLSSFGAKVDLRLPPTTEIADISP